MSDQAVFRQMYDAIVGNLGTPNFQLLGTPKRFAATVAPTGPWDPEAYQTVSGMPLWSAIGQYGSMDATLFDAVRQVLDHVTFKVSPEQQADQTRPTNECVAKSNAMVKANGDMNQVYLSAKQNGGLVFAAGYADINAWIDGAPQAAAYVKTIKAATDAYLQAVQLKVELERASMSSDLQRAIDLMKTPSGLPATDIAPVGWTKVPDGSGILRWQPDYKVDTTSAGWRAELTQGTAGKFSLTMKASDSGSDFSASFARASTRMGGLFWSACASGGWSKSDLYSQDAGLVVTIRCKSSVRVAVTSGDWYPGGFMSELARGEAGSSSIFGVHGIVAARVSALLVVYKPSFEISMSAIPYQKNKQAFDASAGVRIGPFRSAHRHGHRRVTRRPARRPMAGPR